MKNMIFNLKLKKNEEDLYKKLFRYARLFVN